jgi:hypothetical protein
MSKALLGCSKWSRTQSHSFYDAMDRRASPLWGDVDLDRIRGGGCCGLPGENRTMVAQLKHPVKLVVPLRVAEELTAGSSALFCGDF